MARRDLWKVISRMVQGSSDMADSEKTAVILTTHSMEECEALCQRIGIMAGGKLKCLGSAQVRYTTWKNFEFHCVTNWIPRGIASEK